MISVSWWWKEKSWNEARCSTRSLHTSSNHTPDTHDLFTFSVPFLLSFHLTLPSSLSLSHFLSVNPSLHLAPLETVYTKIQAKWYLFHEISHEKSQYFLTLYLFPTQLRYYIQLFSLESSQFSYFFSVLAYLWETSPCLLIPPFFPIPPLYYYTHGDKGVESER